MDTKELIKHLSDSNFSEFRKGYKDTMREKYKQNKEIVTNYVYKKISLGKETFI